MSKGKLYAVLVAMLGMLFTVSTASAMYFINNADGRMIHLKEGTFQPDMSPYMSKLPEIKVVDRTFYPKWSQWAANEEFEISQTGLSNMVRAAFPLAHNPGFIWITNQQLYWGARNNLGFGFAASHSGINMVNGPYWTMKAIELTNYKKVQRDRGERFISNKDLLLSYYFPLYWKITGIPRFPDDGSPAYLEYEGGDPHFIAPTPVADEFDDPQSLKKGKWGIPGYFFQNRQWRWDRDGMIKYLDMGGLGIMLKRASMWVDYMWKATHTGTSPSTQDKRIVLQGNDAEEGFRGIALATTRINQVLAIKTNLVADLDGNLGGINPATYDPAQGLRYLPHRINAPGVLAGDLDVRNWNYEIDDPRSLLFDQAAVLWGSTHLFQSTYRMKEMFTDNPPVDGGLMEKDLGVVPHNVANMVFKNIMAMHTKNGILVSEWKPAKTKWWLFKSYDNPGTGDTFNMEDIALSFIAIWEYNNRMQDPLALIETPNIENMEPELTKQARDLMKRNADLLLSVQGADGSFCMAYNVSGSPTGACDMSQANFAAIVALTSAYSTLDEPKYSAAARKTWNYIWKNFWVEEHGVFRTRLGDDTVVFTAMQMALQLRAWRETMFTTPIHLIKPLIAKFPRYVTQQLMFTNIIQSEENRSGELGMCVGGIRDWDNDGIPWLGCGHGAFGTAPVNATKVAINLGSPGQNEAFNDLPGELHSPERWGGEIKYGYTPHPALKGMILPVNIDYEAMVEDEGWVEREPLLRWDGNISVLPPAKPFKRGSDLKGQQIFEMNCAHCHGYTGEGITGIPFDSDSLARTRDDMFEVPHNGRFTRLMPEWGLGNQDEMESVLTDEEIYRIVDYIQSPAFKKILVGAENGIAWPHKPPKDPFFYISRSYIRGKEHAATKADVALVMNAQREAIETGKPVHVIKRLLAADGQESKDQLASASSWPDALFDKVLSYRNKLQMYYANKPVELKDVAVASTGEPQLDESDLEEDLSTDERGASLDVDDLQIARTP